MGKELHVHLTDEEAQKLQELGNNQSQIIKQAISILHANSHNSNPNQHELTIEVPTPIRLRAMVKESLKEIREEQQREAKERARKEANAASTNKIVDSMMKIAGFKP